MSIKDNAVAAAYAEWESRVRQAAAYREEKEADANAANPEAARLKARINYIDRIADYLQIGLRLPGGIAELVGAGNADLLGLGEEGLSEARGKAVEELKKVDLPERAPVYYCAKCRDTGSVSDGGEQRTCDCVNVLISEELMSLSKLPNGPESLSGFRTDVYPDNADKERYGLPESPRTYAERAVSAGKDFLDGGRTLMFISGQVGVGKTYLACCLAAEAVKRGNMAYYSQISGLLSDLTPKMFLSDEDRTETETRRSMAEEADVLVIDDLGIEFVSEKRYDALLSLIDSRRSRGLKTIITSNLSLASVARDYGERFASRFADLDNSVNVRLAGDDLRLIKKSN